MALNIFLSNSLETLAAHFSKKLLDEKLDVFESLPAVVPNGGMGTFLKRYLAQASPQKIAANIETPFLQKFIIDGVSSFFTADEQKEFRSVMNRWSPDVLCWEIDELLEKNQKELPQEFSDYWQKEGLKDPVKRHLLACELAGNFDRYQLYRSSVANHTTLQEWRQGEAKTPEGVLYSLLCRTGADPDSFFEKFISKSAPLPEAHLPPKAGIFGISSMPPLHFLCLKKLAEHMEIFLFCPSPCQVYWEDLLSSKELQKKLSSGAPEDIFEERARSNQLLADFGVSGREFFSLLLDSGAFSEGSGPVESYKDPAPDEKGNALQLFQSDILNARARTPLNGNEIKVAEEDSSLRINCCTDARRELEILHDQLLELFYGQGKECSEGGAVKLTDKLRPEDVIVMFPDINKAAPVIDAVFSNGPLKGRFAICDRSSVGQSQVIECFSRLLELPAARVTSEEILELLEFNCLNSALGIDPDLLPDLSDLVARARINWGLDAVEHKKFRNTDFTEFSWQDGIDRLMTEYARNEDASVIYSSGATGGIDGELAENFAAAAKLINRLKEWREELHTPRTPEKWGKFMQEWINKFFSDSSKEYLPEVNELRRAAGKIVSNILAARKESEEVIPSEVFISCLKSEYSLPGGKQYFLRDKITFCSLVPLRAVPAKVIAVLGLNDGEFPGVDRRNSFDLLSQKIQRNDPNRANDNRYLFLEALMAAREYLILSYIGSADNGEDLYPAIPLKAVEDVLKKGFGLKKEKISLKSLELPGLEKWRLQKDKAVSPDSGEDEEKEKSSAVSGSSVLPEQMTINMFCRFLTQHCKEFCKLHYGFDYQKFEKAPPAADDPEKISSQDESAVLRALWSMELENIDQSQWESLVKKGRYLPYGDPEAYEQSKDTIKKLLEKVNKEHFLSQEVIKKSITLPCGKSLAGSLAIPKCPGDAFERTVIHFSKFSPEKLFNFYVEQLFLTCYFAGKKSVTGEVIFAKEEENKKRKIKRYAFPQLENPLDTLNGFMEELLKICSQAEPLPLFANASFEQAKGDDAFAKTTRESSVRNKFEKNDLEYQKIIERFFDEEILKTDEFKNLAQKFFGFVAGIKAVEL